MSPSWSALGVVMAVETDRALALDRQSLAGELAGLGLFAMTMALLRRPADGPCLDGRQHFSVLDGEIARCMVCGDVTYPVTRMLEEAWGERVPTLDEGNQAVARLGIDIDALSDRIQKTITTRRERPT